MKPAKTIPLALLLALTLLLSACGGDKSPPPSASTWDSATWDKVTWQ